MRLDPQDAVKRPAPGTATLLLTPSRIVVDPGAKVRVGVSILGADDLSRMPLTVKYDPDVVRPLSVKLGSAWDEHVPPVFLHDTSRPGEIVIGIAWLGSHDPRISGTGELLEIEFRALRSGVTEVKLERFAIIGSESKSQPVTALAASIAVR